MNKTVKKQKNKIVTLFTILIICALGIIIVLTILNKMKPFYLKDDRVNNVGEENKKRDVEVIGWVKVQGTNIDYPIIYNDYFGNVNLNDISYDFVWVNEKPNGLTNRPLIVGHNILNVSKNPLIANEKHARFEQLMSFVYTDFVKKNKYIQYTIDGENYLYKIFSVSFVDDDKIDYYTMEYSKDDLKNYITKSKDDSMYQFDVDVDENDNIISLVTCTRFYGYNANKVFRVDARMVRKDEAVTNYKVTEKNSYNDIKKIMEGDNENETGV